MNRPKAAAKHREASRSRFVDCYFANEYVALGLVILATFAAYWPALNGAKLWDDDAEITSPELQSFQGLYSIWFVPGTTQQYYPVLHSAFWLEHKLWGDATVGYHLVTLFLHTISIVFVYRILRVLKIPGALFAAAIFALHPVMVESVAWICEQKNTLATVLYLAAMLTFIKYDNTGRRVFYFASLALFALALGAKTITVTLPVALLILRWWRQGSLSWRRDVWQIAPFFVMSVLMGSITIWIEREFVGASGSDFELTFLQRALLAGHAIWFYVAKLFWPQSLMFIYPRWTIDPNQASQWSYSIAAVVLTIGLFAVRKRWRGPLAGWLFYCGTLFPLLGFLNVYYFTFSYVTDHSQYLASIGMIVLVAAVITHGSSFFPQPARIATKVLCTLIIGLLATLTWRQSQIYVDDVTLYVATLEHNPNSWLAHNNLGVRLSESGKIRDAIDHFVASLQIKSNNPAAHNNLGMALVKLGNFQQGIDHYHDAIQLMPDFFDAHHNLGIALFLAGRTSEAAAEIQAALTLKNDDPTALNTMGSVLSELGEYSESIRHLKLALRLQPNYAAAHNNLGTVLVETSNFPEAIEHFKEAIRLGSNSPEVYNRLGDAYSENGQIDRALEQYQTALHLNPEYLQIYANLAQRLAVLNRAAEAVETAQKGIEMARFTGHNQAAEKLEEWLSHYQIELRRAAEAASSSQPPSKQ